MYYIKVNPQTPHLARAAVYDDPKDAKFVTKQIIKYIDDGPYNVSIMYVDKETMIKMMAIE